MVKPIIATEYNTQFSDICFFSFSDIDECGLIDVVYCANSLELCINTIGSFYCECQQGYQRVNNTCRGWPLFIIFRIVNRVLKIENLSPFTLHRSSKQERLRCTKIAPLNGELRSSKFIKRKILKVTWNFFIVKYVVVRRCGK